MEEMTRMSRASRRWDPCGNTVRNIKRSSFIRLSKKLNIKKLEANLFSRRRIIICFRRIGWKRIKYLIIGICGDKSISSRCRFYRSRPDTYKMNPPFWKWVSSCPEQLPSWGCTPCASSTPPFPIPAMQNITRWSSCIEKERWTNRLPSSRVLWVGAEVHSWLLSWTFRHRFGWNCPSRAADRNKTSKGMRDRSTSLIRFETAFSLNLRVKSWRKSVCCDCYRHCWAEIWSAAWREYAHLPLAPFSIQKHDSPSATDR